MRIAIIGAGNMGGAIARGLSVGSKVNTKDIICSNPSNLKLEKLKEEFPDLSVTNDNEKAVKGVDVVILAVKPWLIEGVINQIKGSLDFSKQYIVSIAAGVTFEQLLNYFDAEQNMLRPILFQVIPNTAIAMMSSVTFISSENATEDQANEIVALFNELGFTLLIEEKMMGAGTALASCGIAFALRYIRAATEGGVEMGFTSKQASDIVAHTVKGAADLLITNKSSAEDEIDKVTTPGGITIKGLNEMEHANFTSAVIKGLKAAHK